MFLLNIQRDNRISREKKHFLLENGVFSKENICLSICFQLLGDDVFSSETKELAGVTQQRIRSWN